MCKEELRLPSDTLLSVIRRASDTFGIPMELLIAIAWQESRYHSGAVGRHGEHGIYQMREGAWQDADATLPLIARRPYSQAHDDLVSTRYVCRYLYCIATKNGIGNLNTPEGLASVLQSYNGGVGNYKRGTVSQSAKRYAKNVLQHMRDAKQLLDIAEGRV